MKTRTIAYVAPKKVDVREVSVVDPADDQIQVQKIACGICAWDLSTYKYGPDNPYAAPAGHEGLARVLKVGKGVKGFKEGDHLMGGGFQEVENLDPTHAVRIPYEVRNPLQWIVEPVSC